LNQAFFGRNALTCEGLRLLTKSVKSFTSIDLTGCLGVMDEGLVAVTSRLPALTHLDLSLCHRVTADGLHELDQLPALTSLHLCENDHQLDDVLLHTISQLTALTTLTLSGCPGVSWLGTTRHPPPPPRPTEGQRRCRTRRFLLSSGQAGCRMGPEVRKTFQAWDATKDFLLATPS